ncbi:site-specific integrase [Maribacter sp. 2304DJ31-5]|uniref:site-specific integrase n=1 Tax=Maribacter sp. 2304DJ31-5 TaxID=3386273 RepID=UPI0039BCBA6B
MKTSHTFSILFWINSSRATNGNAELFARVTVNGKRINISLKKKIPIFLWDSKRKKIKGNSNEARQINEYLNQVRTRLFQSFQDLKFKGGLITAELIKADYLGESENSKTLQEILKYHNRKIEKTLASGTIRNFGISENYINRYLQQKLKTTDIYLRKLDYKFISDFETFLIGHYPKGHPKAMSHNTVMKHLQKLGKIVTLAYHLEWIDKDPFIRWKPTFETKQREFLSANELSNLETYAFPLERLDRVRDLFVFSCYTGIAYIDIMNLTKNNILKGVDGSDWIFTNRQKTKSPVTPPLLSKTQDLIHKYENYNQIHWKLFPCH